MGRTRRKFPTSRASFMKAKAGALAAAGRGSNGSGRVAASSTRAQGIDMLGATLGEPSEPRGEIDDALGDHVDHLQSRCNRPVTATKRAPMTIRRSFSKTFGRTMILAMPVSSSIGHEDHALARARPAGARRHEAKTSDARRPLLGGGRCHVGELFVFQNAALRPARPGRKKPDAP